MTVRRVVAARLLRLWRDLLGYVTLRRHEKRWQTYALRLVVVAMIVVVIPAKKVIQLGILSLVLALVKTAVAAALLVALLAAVFAAQELSRRAHRRPRVASA